MDSWTLDYDPMKIIKLAYKLFTEASLIYIWYFNY